VSVSAPVPEAATPGTKVKSVRTVAVTEVADTRPLYPAYRPNIPEPPAVARAPVAMTPPPPAALSPAPMATTPAPAAPSTTGQSSNAVEPAAAQPTTTAQPDAAPAQSAQIEATAPAQPAQPAVEKKSAPIMFAQAPAPAPPPAPAPAAFNCPGNPNALGVSRVVEIDTTGGPGFGFEHFKNYDFLREGEVVLTFDDGPWPRNTAAVLAALARHCTRAIFFPIGLHATYEPGILKQVAQAGHAVGSHTWSHQMLDKNKGRFKVAGTGKFEVREFDPKDEIEKGISAVKWAVNGPTAPFFRFPGLKHPPELVAYLGQRNFGIFSTDFDSFDFKIRKPDQLRQSVMAKLKKHGKGIALMHDFQHSTAEAINGMLDDLKAGGYKIVFMRPKFAAQTLPQYDEMIVKEMKLPGSDNARPMSNVIKTVE
jgi:peptidoglycan/xylan/chitin deacetylase (PgdA/CDA1 family)